MRQRGMRWVALGVLGLGVVAIASSVQAGHIVCGDVLGPGGTHTLDSNVGTCTGSTDPALTVIGPATLDMAGFALLCDGNPDGILILGNRAKVRNGRVSDCDEGVQVGGVGHHRITGLVSENNSDEGFHILSGSNHNVLESCAATDNSGDGIEVDGDHNLIQRCVAADNGEYGFHIDGDGNQFIRNSSTSNSEHGFTVHGDKNVFEYNTALGNGDEGFDVTNRLNRFSYNTASNNDNAGFRLSGDRNTLTNNTATQNGDPGFQLDSSAEGNVLELNMAVENPYGFRLEDGATGNRLERNRALDNHSDGIKVLEGAVRNRFTGNRALTNADDDIDDDNPGCGGNQWKKNIFGDAESDTGCIQ